MNRFAQNLALFRKQKGLTQDDLARQLNLTYQAISKWENAQSMPDLMQLTHLADIFSVTTDALLGHEPTADARPAYEDRYRSELYYWGTEPATMCYEVMRLRPPVRPLKLLDVGCGEGKDAVFFARNGYDVTAFDLSPAGIDKGRRLADACGVQVRFFQADALTWRPEESFDIIYCSGVLHYLPRSLRGEILHSWQTCTSVGGVHALNAFVGKSFIPTIPSCKLYCK